MQFTKSAAAPKHRLSHGLQKAGSRGSLDNSLPNLVSYSRIISITHFEKETFKSMPYLNNSYLIRRLFLLSPVLEVIKCISQEAYNYTNCSYWSLDNGTTC